MKKLILGCALATAFNVNAQQVIGEIYRSADSDGTVVVKYPVALRYAGPIGVSFTESTYTTPTSSFGATTVSAIVDYKKGEYAVDGNAGVSMMVKTYFTGDITGHRQVTIGPVKADLGVTVYGDIVDSQVGLADKITYLGAALSGDISTDSFGVAGDIRQTNYTNNNTKTGWSIKGYAPIMDGVTIYLINKQYRNSNPFNGAYYSPESYRRTSVGMSFRQRFSDILISGKVEPGMTYTSDGRDSVYLWQLTAKYSVTSRLSINGTVGSDVDSASSYTFNHSSITVKYDF